VEESFLVVLEVELGRATATIRADQLDDATVLVDLRGESALDGALITRGVPRSHRTAC
jgi:hypothetical protein